MKNYIKIIFLLVIFFFNSLHATTIEIAKELFDKKEKYREALEIFEKYQNDGEAQYYIGKAYYYGLGIEKNYGQAFEYAKKSANQNNPSGLNLLGVLYETGDGVKKDELKALIQYKHAASLNNINAIINISGMYLNSGYVKQDPNQAIEWIKKALDLGHIDAARILGNIYSSTEINNFTEAIKYYNYFFMHSNSQDMFADTYERLGILYAKQQNYNNAYINYKKAIDLGKYNRACDLFDLAYKYGLKDKKEEALKYLKTAADNNDSLSVQTLAYYYFYDIQEYDEAINVLKKSYYKFENLQSGCHLASFLNHEFDTEINTPKILSSYNPELSFQIVNNIIKKYPKDKNISSCYTTLAIDYERGNYTNLDYKKAIEIYQDIIDTYPLHKDSTKQRIKEIEEKIINQNKYSHSLVTKNSNSIYPIINSFTKPSQVLSCIESKKYFFLSADDKSIKIYDKKNLLPITELRAWIDYGISGAISNMAYDEQNQFLYVSMINSDKDMSKNDSINVFDINSQKIIKTLTNKQAIKNTYLHISDDGKYLVAINNETQINIIDTRTNEIQHYNLYFQGKFNQARIEKINDDYLIYLLSIDNQLYTFSLNKKRRIKKEVYSGQVKFRTFDVKCGEKIFDHPKSFDLKNVSRTEKNIYIENYDNSLYSFNTKHLMLSQYKNAPIKISQANKIKIISQYNNRLLGIYDENDNLLSQISLLYLNALSFHVLDNKYILVITSDISQLLVFTLDGKPIANLQGFKALQTNISYNDGLLISFGNDSVINFFDLKYLEQYSQKEKKYNQEILQGFRNFFGEDPLNFLNEINDGNIAVMAKKGEFNFGFLPTAQQVKSYFEIILFEREEIKPLASLYIKNEKDWIIYTPEGLFTYGGDGNNLLKYHQNQGLYKEAKIVENEKLFDKFYRPDLIKKIFAGDKVDIPMDVKSVILNIKPPKLEILENKMTNGKDIYLTYKICDAGNGVADPKLIINGQAINPPSSRGFSIEKVEAQEQKCKVYKSTHTLYPGKSTIELRAYDKDKYISNKSEKVEVNAAYKIIEKSNISYGNNSDIDTFRNNELILDKPNLYFLSLAVSDYKDDKYDLKYPVKDVIAIKEQFLEKSQKTFENVFTYELIDDKVSKENINKIFDDIAQKIKMNDIFLVYLAGHGTTIDGKYQFIPYEINNKVSIDNLKENLSKIAANTNKSIVMLDTCYSGAIIDNINDSATKNRLAYDSTINYIVASSSNQVALEGYKEHGIFTYSVLDAFQKNKNLKVWGLANHVSELVPKITQEKFYFKQVPQSKLNKNFILAGDKN